MAITLKKARRTLMATAVLWAMGLGVAGAAGNTLEGPKVTGGASTAVKILQVGTDNVISATGETGGGAFVVNAVSSKVTLTIQQVGKAGTSDANKLALAAYTNDADATIKVFQGSSGPGGDPGSNEAPVAPTAVTNNTATVNIGTDSILAGAITLNLQQQSSYNEATVKFGTITPGTAGTLNLVQKGTASSDGEGNTAILTIDGATASTYTLTQDGKSNEATVTASGMLGNLTVTQTGDGNSLLLDVGAIGVINNTGVSITMTGVRNDAQTDHDKNGVGMAAGISLGSITGFDLTVTGNDNKIQVDLTNASTSSKVSGLSLTGDNNTLSIYGNLGTVMVDRVTASGDLSISAAGGSISLTRIDLGGNSSFSTTTGGSIVLKDINVLGTNSLTVSAGTGTISLSDLTLTDNSTFSTDPTVGSNFTFSLAAGKEAIANVGSNTFSLTNSGSGTVTSAKVVQKDSGAKKFSMNNQTVGATINVTQDGAGAHTATGINFAAGDNSTFTLVQR